MKTVILLMALAVSACSGGSNEGRQVQERPCSLLVQGGGSANYYPYLYLCDDITYHNGFYSCIVDEKVVVAVGTFGTVVRCF